MKLNNKGVSMVIIIAAVVVLLGAMGAGVAIMKMKTSGGAKVPEKKPVNMVSLGDFVVNLADTTEVRYVKTNIVLGVEGELKAEGGGGGKEGEAGGGTDNAPVRDAIIQALSSKCFADIIKPNGKEALKKEIIATVNKRIKDAKVVEVYFNEFAMQ